MTERVSQAYAAYLAAFGEFPPTLYMMDLPDDEAIAMLDLAVSSGKEINPEEFEGELGEGETLY